MKGKAHVILFRAVSEEILKCSPSMQVILGTQMAKILGPACFSDLLRLASSSQGQRFCGRECSCPKWKSSYDASAVVCGHARGPF